MTKLQPQTFEEWYGIDEKRELGPHVGEKKVAYEAGQKSVQEVAKDHKDPREMKYIVIDDGYGNEQPIIFSALIEHALFQAIFPKIISAGFCKHNENGLVCWGKSVSLGLKSRHEKDNDLMNISLFEYAQVATLAQRGPIPTL